MNNKAGEHRRSELYAALTSQSLCATIGPGRCKTIELFSIRHWNLRNLKLQQECYLTNTRAFFRLHSTFARLYNAAASPSSRLRRLVGNKVGEENWFNRFASEYLSFHIHTDIHCQLISSLRSLAVLSKLSSLAAITNPKAAFSRSLRARDPRGFAPCFHHEKPNRQATKAT